MKKNVASLLIAGGVALAATSAFGEGQNVPGYDRNAPADDAAGTDADRRMPAGDPAMDAPGDDAAGADRDMPRDDPAMDVPADNSGRNVRDRSEAALTPGDQSGSPQDIAITRKIRQAVVADPDLSVNAQNIKIITINGVVTLRGPVENAAERQNIAATAKKVTGVTRVDNQLELTGE